MIKRTVVAVLAGAVLFAGCGSGSSSEAEFNDSDVMFAQMMIPHHEQALELAAMALDPARGASAAVTGLAERIRDGQGPEIDQLNQLLAEWGASGDDGMDHSSMMGGMLTADELASLAALQGPEFDARWSVAVIAHHEGAIDMANSLLDNGANADLIALAQRILEAQQAEIDELRAMTGS